MVKTTRDKQYRVACAVSVRRVLCDVTARRVRVVRVERSSLVTALSLRGACATKRRVLSLRAERSNLVTPVRYREKHRASITRLLQRLRNDEDRAVIARSDVCDEAVSKPRHGGLEAPTRCCEIATAATRPRNDGKDVGPRNDKSMVAIARGRVCRRRSAFVIASEAKQSRNGVAVFSAGLNYKVHTIGTVA